MFTYPLSKNQFSLPSDLDLVTLTFILLQGKDVVVINIRTNFGSILHSRLRIKKKFKKTDANTNCTNSLLQSLLMRQTYRSNWKCPCFEEPSCQTSRLLLQNFLSYDQKYVLSVLVCGVTLTLDVIFIWNISFSGMYPPKIKTSSDQRFLRNGPYNIFFDLRRWKTGKKNTKNRRRRKH